MNTLPLLVAAVTGSTVAIAGLVSAVLILASVVAVPWGVRRLPEDWFTRPRRHLVEIVKEDPPGKVALRILRNLLGLALVVAGVTMLVVPGPGLIAVLLGIAMVDFPGQHKLLVWIGCHRPVAKQLQKIRRKGDCPPFEGIPCKDGGDG